MRLLVSAGLVALAGAAWAASYEFRSDPAAKQGIVTVRLGDKTATQFRMPAWAPGDYEIFNYGNKIVSISFSLKGKKVEAKKGSDPNLWEIQGGADTVVYRVAESRGNFSDNLKINDVEFFISGAGVFGWFPGDESNPQTVTLNGLTSKMLVSCPLPGKKEGASATFRAKNYDQLLDSPIVASETLRSHAFAVQKIPHEIVSFGRRSAEPLDPIGVMAGKIVAANFELFGALPYPDYKFMLDLGGFPAGLEHGASTRIGAWSLHAEALSDIMSHEYFHSFNVKVIRPQVLGPFDYTKPAVTGSLWWLEGVTDYYASIILARAGIINREEAIEEFGQDYVRFQRNGARLRVSADEASRRVWEVRGSQGFGGLSYYEKGRLIGLTLDLAIRRHSNGQSSLDNVIRALFQECFDGEGFHEGRIRELCIKYGGEPLGPIYDQSVMTTQELPLASLLKDLGFAWDGRTLKDDPLAKNAIGQRWPMPVK